jgi:hypothetical protein
MLGERWNGGSKRRIKVVARNEVAADIAERGNSLIGILEQVQAYKSIEVSR